MTLGRMLIGALAVSLSVPGVSSANADPEHRFIPPFHSVDTERDRSVQGPTATASATVSALPEGVIDLSTATSSQTPLASASASASAAATVSTGAVPWSDTGLRLEADIHYDVHSERTHTELGTAESSWHASVGFSGGDFSIVDVTTFDGIEYGTSGVIGSSTYQSADSVTVSIVARPVCGHDQAIRPNVTASAKALSGSLYTVDNESEIVARFTVKEICVFREPSVACFERVRVNVLDNEFSPRHSSAPIASELTFAFSAAQNQHDVFLLSPGGSLIWAWPYDDPYYRLQESGTYRFWCELHGSQDGSGMAGTVAVT